MAKIKVRKDIEIGRNIIEQTLMNIRDFIRNNKKNVNRILILISIICIAVIAALYMYQDHLDKHLIIYEKIMDNYELNREKDPEIVKKTVEDLMALSGSVKFGFIDEIVYFNIGSLLYSEKKFKEAKDYLVKFANVSSSGTLSAIALNKAAIALEESGNIDGAINIFTKMEKDFSDSIIADQMYYNMGRLFSIKKSAEDARRYYNRVISLFPQSSFAGKAKKRLFLISLK